MANPMEMLEAMEEAVKSYIRERTQEFSNYDGKSSWQVCIKSDENPRVLRHITSNSVSKLFVISGIIISCTKPYIKAS